MIGNNPYGFTNTVVQLLCAKVRKIPGLTGNKNTVASIAADFGDKGWNGYQKNEEIGFPSTNAEAVAGFQCMDIPFTNESILILDKKIQNKRAAWIYCQRRLGRIAIRIWARAGLGLIYGMVRKVFTMVNKRRKAAVHPAERSGLGQHPVGACVQIPGNKKNAKAQTN